MKILVTGSSGHLGEAPVRTLRDSAHTVVGLDILPSPFTDLVGSIVDREEVLARMADVDAVLHPATLHEPPVGTHSQHDKRFWRCAFTTPGRSGIVLRTARFFPEADANQKRRDACDDSNRKVNEHLNRRADMEDIVSATTPFRHEDLADLRIDVPSVLRRGMDPRRQLARNIGSKGYHTESSSAGPYPTESS